MRPGLDTEGSAIHQGDTVSRPGLNGYVQTGSQWLCPDRASGEGRRVQGCCTSFCFRVHWRERVVKKYREGRKFEGMTTRSEMDLPINTILQGDCVQKMQQLPTESIDLVFADPPYNLQLRQELYRPNLTRVDAVNDSWDQFRSFEEYDRFSRGWLQEARRLLKPTGTIWVIGSYHNIYRLGSLMQDLGFWILNDVIWIKTNPMPNFRGVRFSNAHETLVWASKEQGAKYTFNHHAMKSLHGNKQMRSDWLLPLCTGKERLRLNGEKAHSTQKPEALLYRVILSSSQPGDVVLDPFFGTGTTGAVAKALRRSWIGIEREQAYIDVARERIDGVEAAGNEDLYDVRDKRRLAARVPFGRLLELGLLHPGDEVYFRAEKRQKAVVRADGKLVMGEKTGSIHQLGRALLDGGPCNGWNHWYYSDGGEELKPVDNLRRQARLILYGDEWGTEKTDE